MMPRTVVRLVRDLEYGQETLGGARVVRLAAGTRGVVIEMSRSGKVWVLFLPDMSPHVDMELDPDMVEPDEPTHR